MWIWNDRGVNKEYNSIFVNIIFLWLYLFWVGKVELGWIVGMFGVFIIVVKCNRYLFL